MKQTGLNGYVYDFSVDYDIIAVDDILNIHNQYNTTFGLIKKCSFTGFAFLWTLTRVNMLRCISITNKECKVRPEIVNPIKDGLFWGCSQMGWGQKSPHYLKSVTHIKQ